MALGIVICYNYIEGSYANSCSQINMQNKLSANLALFMTALIWGLSFVAQRAGMEYIDPYTFNMVRCFLGGLSLIPVILWVKVSTHDTRTPEVKHFQHINLERAGIACGVALFLAMTIQQYCMKFVCAGKGGFITALYIVFVPILTVLLGDKLKKRIIISVIFALFGLYLLCYKSDGGVGIYDLLLLLSAFFYAVHIMVVDYFSRVVNPVKASCLQFFVVGLLSLVLVLLFEKPDISAILACKIPLLYAGVITCGVAYTLQIFGQKYTLPVIASLIFSTEAVFAVLGGVLILGETLSPKEFVGCVFMIAAVILSNIKCNKKCD